MSKHFNGSPSPVWPQPNNHGGMYAYYDICDHTAATRLGASDGVELWAGSLDDLVTLGQCTLVVSAVEPKALLTPGYSMSESAKAMLPSLHGLYKPPALVYIDWIDGRLPTNLPKGFWDCLLQEAAASAEASGKPVKLGLCCMGGHGRTGVMAAILAAKLNLVPEKQHPIRWLRAKYCQSVVETEAQVNYVGRILGISVKGIKSSGQIKADKRKVDTAKKAPPTCEATASEGAAAKAFNDPTLPLPTPQELVNDLNAGRITIGEAEEFADVLYMAEEDGFIYQETRVYPDLFDKWNQPTHYTTAPASEETE